MTHNKCQIEQNNDVLITMMLQKSHKIGNSNDSDESTNINNRYQNRFLIQVLITIRKNPVLRIKQNAISDTVFNFQSPWRHYLQSTSLIIFSL